MKNWYSIQNKADTADISIHDEIGLFGTSAKDFLADLKGVSAGTINLSINSPGGNVFDGLAIYNELSSSKSTVNVTIAGIAGSIASVIAMAGDTVSMPEEAFLMIHNPFTMAFGGAEDMRETADLLDKITDSIVNIYAKKTSQDESVIRELMDAGESNSGTFMTGAEAKELGFVDKVTNQKIAACAKFANHFKDAPFAKVEHKFEALKDFTAYLRESCGKTRSESEQVTNAVKKLMQSDSVEPEAQLNEVSNLLLNLTSKLEGKIS